MATVSTFASWRQCHWPGPWRYREKHCSGTVSLLLMLSDFRVHTKAGRHRQTGWAARKLDKKLDQPHFARTFPKLGLPVNFHRRLDLGQERKQGLRSPLPGGFNRALMPSSSLLFFSFECIILTAPHWVQALVYTGATPRGAWGHSGQASAGPTVGGLNMASHMLGVGSTTEPRSQRQSSCLESWLNSPSYSGSRSCSSKQVPP